jgi:hypothetical protein
MSKGIKLDFETADSITRDNLKDTLKMHEREVKNHLKKGAYLHPDDLVNYQTVMIPALKTLITYYGG